MKRKLTQNPSIRIYYKAEEPGCEVVYEIIADHVLGNISAEPYGK